METRRTDTHSPILPLGERVAMARRTLVELSDAERLADLSDQDLLDALKELEALGRLIDAGRAFAAGEVQQRSRKELGDARLCVKKGFTRAVDLVADATGTSTVAAHRRITQAQPLRPAVSVSGREEPSPFPLIRAGVGAGLVATETSLVITGALQEARDRGAAPDRVGDGERALLAAVLGADCIREHMAVFGDRARALLSEACDSTPGRGRTLAQVRRLASAWRVMLVQEADRSRGEEAERIRTTEREHAENRRHLRLLPSRGGTRRIEGELLPEVAAQLERILDAYMNPRVDGSRHGVGDTTRHGKWLDLGVRPATAGVGDLRAGAEVLGAPPPPGPEVDRRSRGQRLHDAFGGVLTVAAGVPDMPLLGGAPPTLVVTIDRSQLDAPLGRAFLSGTHDEDASDVDSRSRRWSPAVPVGSRSSVLPHASSPRTSAGPSRFATVAAASLDARFPRHGARSTTSTSIPRVDQHTPTTARCCAGTTTANSTSWAGTSACGTAHPG